MIRINLLPQPRPKARRAAAGPATGAFQSIVLLVGLLVGLFALAALYILNARELEQKQARLSQLQQDKAKLDRIQSEVDAFRKQKDTLDQRIAVIQELQRNKIGGQELLDAVANTVVRTETLWLTQMERKGNLLTFEGTASSLTAVANFITQLQRSGYFQRVEIRESHQDETNKDVQTFIFTLGAEFVLPGTQQQPQTSGGQQPPAGKT